MLSVTVEYNSKRLKLKIHLKNFRRHFRGQCLISKESIDTTQSAVPAKFESKTSEASESTCICTVATLNRRLSRRLSIWANFIVSFQQITLILGDKTNFIAHFQSAALTDFQ